jgi:thiamine biosynthesis lipoprotein
MASPVDRQASTCWPLWAGTAHLVVRERRPGDLQLAAAAVGSVVDAVDLACSRFRPDSEVRLLAAGHGRRTVVSDLLADLVGAALGAAAATGGAVDPTLGLAMVAAGYDQALAEPGAGPAARAATTVVVRRATSWRDIELSVDAMTGAPTLSTPAGLLLDLGATAKARAADLAAAGAHAATGCAVLVSLCGDLAVAANEADQPWLVQVLERPDDVCGPMVHVYDGGVATSSTRSRHWTRQGQAMHHLLDPATARPVRAFWRTVTVAAASCLEANTASTAAVVMGAGGARWLASTGLPARLVAADGRVRTLNDWPLEPVESVS